MPIVIKEIHVKTIVQQHTQKEIITEERLLRLKQSVVKEVLSIQKRKSDWEKER